jgi:hypothetical protein
MKEYKLKPHQHKLVDLVFNLNQQNLYYGVTQTNIETSNHTVNELKKHIKSAIKKYSRDYLLHKYFYNSENKLFQFVLFIEFPKDFYLSISNIEQDILSMYNGVHLHLFISSRDNLVCMKQLFHYIFLELTSQKNKCQSVKKYDYFKIDELSRRFVEYHTKQHYTYVDNERLMFNV